MNSRLEPLVDLLAELLVRRLKKETPSAFGGQHDGVEDNHDEYTPIPPTAETVRVVSRSV